MESIQQKLQQLDPAIVWLDTDNRITAMNADDRLFIGVQRRCIVNMHCVKVFETSDEQYHLLLDQRDGTKIPVSRRHLALLKELPGLP